jgi:nitroreductase
MVTRRQINAGILSTAAVATVRMSGTAAFAQTVQTITLPAPVMTDGKLLMQALNERQSIRDYADRPLTDHHLSDLLWAAWGVNRAAGDGRTAPRWRDAYLLDIYVIRVDGVWRYEPKGHRLLFHMAGDFRGQTTTGQSFVATAPLNLVYAVDLSKLTGSAGEKNAVAGATAAVSGENVYLYCASAGLATVFRGSVPGEALAKTLKLAPGQVIQFAQTVGYPKT